MSPLPIIRSHIGIRKPQNKKGFTLIELLLGVTLSAILMTGITVFVSNLLASNMTTEKSLESQNKNEDFEQRFTEVLENLTGSGIYATGTGFWGIYSTGLFLATGGANLSITFVGLKTQTGYCDGFSWTASETGTVTLLTIRQFASPSEQNHALGYTLSSSWNAVFSGASRIIGTGHAGADITGSGIDTELSFPSALISSWTRLYIADTMNDRILSYGIGSGDITQLVGPENGIRRPTSLSFSGNALLIASSGNGRIYRLQDGDCSNRVSLGGFRVSKNFSADTFRFVFDGIPLVQTPQTAGNFHLSGTIQNPSDTVSTGSSLIYSETLQSFGTTAVYGFDIDNLSPLPTIPGNYAVRVDFQSGGGVVEYSDIFHYCTIGDGSLESATGNILKTVAENLTYPHILSESSTWSGTIDWNHVLGENPAGEELLSTLPVRDFSFQTAGKVLTLRYHEYVHYDCISSKHRVEEKIRKILLP